MIDSNLLQLLMMQGLMYGFLVAFSAGAEIIFISEEVKLFNLTFKLDWLKAQEGFISVIKSVFSRKSLPDVIRLIIVLIIVLTIIIGIREGVLILDIKFTPVRSFIAILIEDVIFFIGWSLVIGFCCLVFGGVIWGLVKGVLQHVEKETTELPNQGIWQSGKSAVVAVVSFILLSSVLTLSVGVILEMSTGYTDEILNYFGIIGLRIEAPIALYTDEILNYFGAIVLSIGTPIAVAIGLYFGGLAVMQHFFLRLILCYNHHIPWNYACFLDYAARCIFLRKIGGGYIFVHQLLLEHFALLGKEGMEHEKEAAQSKQYNRRILLDRVKSLWIEERLEKSLYKGILLQLDKQRPWGVFELLEAIEKQEVAECEFLSSPKEKAISKEKPTLLLLGAPGSGKTITLLELARDTISCAENDSTVPIPVIFNLSSWIAYRQSLAEWIVAELEHMYQIPTTVANAWIENKELLLLLDGLDEVKQDSQDNCVDAMNQFQQEYSLTGMVVCSRTEEYNTLSAKLNIQRAIELQPLTMEQIDAYLAATGSELESLRTLIQENTDFQELAESPLMLSMMVLAYQGMPTEEMRDTRTLEERRKRLFDLYTEHMLKRKGADKLYTSQQTVRWLSWLAYRMSYHSLTKFSILDIQPTWLKTPVQLKLCKACVWFIIILACVMPNLLVAPLDRMVNTLNLKLIPWVPIEFSMEISVSIVIGAFVSFLIIISLIILMIKDIVETTDWVHLISPSSWEIRLLIVLVAFRLAIGSFVGFIAGLSIWIVGLIAELIIWIAGQSDVWLNYGLIEGLLF